MALPGSYVSDCRWMFLPGSHGMALGILRYPTLLANANSRVDKMKGIG